MTRDLKPQEPMESQAGKAPALPRVAALPGADRRILRKRMEWPFKAIRQQPNMTRSSGR